MDVSISFFLIFCAFACARAEDPTADTLNAIIEDKERIVTRIADATLEVFSGECSYNCGELCAVLSCGSLLPEPGAQCRDDYGAEAVRVNTCERDCTSRRLNFDQSAIRTASPNITKEIITEECLTRTLDSVFIDNQEKDSLSPPETLRWQYVGTPTGFFRLFPFQVIEQCHAYDPRIRPWYVAATSGPKDVILIIDVSSSMLNYDRLNVAQDAAITVIETLTTTDFVTVVVFNETAKQLLIPGQTDGSLLTASRDNKDALIESVSSINASGLTNFEAAFNLAFDILGSTGENSSKCHTAILFLTDGHPNKGKTSQDYFECLVKERSQQAVIFTYTLGAVRAETAAITKGIACASNGIYAHVDDGGNLREQLSQYYDYFASLRSAGHDDVTWVEPYLDYAGAGQLVTASKAVYDFEIKPARLVGVAAVDIRVDDLEIAANESNLDFTALIKRLASRNTCPDIITDRKCELDLIRKNGGGEACDLDSDESCSNFEDSSSKVCESTPGTISYCDYRENRYESDAETFHNQSCCLRPAELPGTCNDGIKSAKALHFMFTVVFALIALAALA